MKISSQMHSTMKKGNKASTGAAEVLIVELPV
jgi:hypothetical protein